MSDYDNRWISIFEQSGKFVSKIGGNKILGPKGLAVSGSGELIVVDNKVRCVCYFFLSYALYFRRHPVPT